MKRSLGRTSILGLLIVAVLMGGTLTSCAWMFNGFHGKEVNQRAADINWGYFILDIVFTAGIGLIVDFATGAIYYSKGGGVARYMGPAPLCEEAKELSRHATPSTLEGFATQFAKHVEKCHTCMEALRSNEGTCLTRDIDPSQVKSLETPILVGSH